MSADDVSDNNAVLAEADDLSDMNAVRAEASDVSSRVKCQGGAYRRCAPRRRRQSIPGFALKR